jgi:OOP family OmpA-OmpF porin
MKHRHASTALLAALGLALAVPALAQSRSTADGLRMPNQRNFWGYAGLNLGRSDYNIGCAGTSCDNNGNTAKVYLGGKFNNNFGLELGYVNMGTGNFAGGDVKAQGLNVSLVGGVPVGSSSSIFGKIGTTAGRTRVSGTIPTAATGSEDGWGMSYGVGALIGISPNWGVRLDADRYRFDFRGIGDKNVDTLTVGLQYNFR